MKKNTSIDGTLVHRAIGPDRVAGEGTTGLMRDAWNYRVKGLSMRALCRLGGAMLAGVLCLVPALALACIDSGEAVCTSSFCGEKFRINTDSTMHIYRSYSLGQTHCAVTRAIVVIHGRGGTGFEAFTALVGAAQLSGELTHTLIIAPFFPDDREGTYPLVPSDLAWQRNLGSAVAYDWAMGGMSATPSQVSAYDVVDDILHDIATSGQFPNLTSITVAGHSAGGQFAQRYAAGGNRDGLPGLRYHYIVANPSSYVYLNGLRPNGDSVTDFSVYSSSTCPSYNAYGYGLEGLTKSAYMSQLSSSQVITQYLPRKVTYLLGDQDTDTAGLDVTCYANAEGANRFVRGTAFYNYVRQYYPDATNHARVVVPGVGHSATKMFQSVEGRAALFADLSGPTVDTQPPTVSIVNPSGGTVSGLVAVDVAASDNVGVSRVELRVNGGTIATDTSAPFSFGWDSTGLATSTATLTAIAYDAVGNNATSAPVAVSVASPTSSGDVTPPLVTIANPAAGNVSRTVTISVTASDDHGTAGISLSIYIDGALKTSGTGGSLSYSWSTKSKSIKAGSHTIQTVAQDAAGNLSSDSVVVNVVK